MSEEHITPFEQIRHLDEQGGEYWWARELSTLLGYSRWQKFTAVIERVEAACRNANINPADHLHPTVQMVDIGSSAKRRIKDYKLSRYACYLVVQNADPSKEIVALGQNYFVIQTRLQELDNQSDKELERLGYYDQLQASNNDLRYQAAWAGIIRPEDFAIFQDHGYRGLYEGEAASDIQRRKGLELHQDIEDWMGNIELAANSFRASQTAAALERQGIRDKQEAHDTAHQVGRIVRATIKEIGNEMPETLPTPDENIHQVRARKLTEKRPKELPTEKAGE